MQRIQMMITTELKMIRMRMMTVMVKMMMKKPELALTPSDLVTELPGDQSSSSLPLLSCSSVTENQKRKDKLKKRKKRRMEKPKSHILSELILNHPSSLARMYLMNHCPIKAFFFLPSCEPRRGQPDFLSNFMEVWP